MPQHAPFFNSTSIPPETARLFLTLSFDQGATLGHQSSTILHIIDDEPNKPVPSLTTISNISASRSFDNSSTESNAYLEAGKSSFFDIHSSLPVEMDLSSSVWWVQAVAVTHQAFNQGPYDGIPAKLATQSGIVQGIVTWLQEESKHVVKWIPLISGDYLVRL